MSNSTTITMYRGDDFFELVTFKDSNGNVIDITNYLVFLTVKVKSNDVDEDALFQTINGIGGNPHTNAINGETILHIPNTLSDFPIGSFYYDIQIKTPEGYIKTIVSGDFRVIQDKTLITEVPT